MNWLDYCHKDHWHPAANLFPLIAGEEFDELVADIKENGVYNPVILFENKVLDGRNRLMACKKAVIKPRFETWNPSNGNSPVSWVISQNLHRRQLSASQKAIVGMEAEALFAEDARKRQLATLKQGDKHPVKQQFAEREGKAQARDSAAKLVGVNRQYVSDAKRIAARAPEMVKEIKQGILTITEAKKKLGFAASVSAMTSSESNEWYTPKNYVKAVHSVLGEIDLDPASCEVANKVVRAKQIFTRDEDGLKHHWHGRIWLNPPYADDGPKFVAKLLREYESGNVAEALLIVNSHCTDSKWFQPLYNYTLCFTDHRTQFWNNQKSSDRSTHGSVIVYFGKHKTTFTKTFSDFGAVLQKVTS